MDRDKETFNTWNNVAHLYQERFMNLNLYNETYDHVCISLSKQNAKLLEIGCGPGNITQYLLQKRPDFKIFGIDIAPTMIELARLNNPAASFAVMDCRQIRKLDAGYDGIIGGFCLPYLSAIESGELIAASYDLLNLNGLLYLSFVEGDIERSGFKVGSGGRVYFYYHALKAIESLLYGHHFSEIETFKVQYAVSETEFETHTLLTARKRK